MHTPLRSILNAFGGDASKLYGLTVRATLDPEHDHEYEAHHRPVRAAHDGQKGVIVYHHDSHGLCFDVDHGALPFVSWELDELHVELTADETDEGPGRVTDEELAEVTRLDAAPLHETPVPEQRLQELGLTLLPRLARAERERRAALEMAVERRKEVDTAVRALREALESGEYTFSARVESCLADVERLAPPRALTMTEARAVYDAEINAWLANEADARSQRDVIVAAMARVMTVPREIS